MAEQRQNITFCQQRTQIDNCRVGSQNVKPWSTVISQNAKAASIQNHGAPDRFLRPSSSAMICCRPTDSILSFNTSAKSRFDGAQNLSQKPMRSPELHKNIVNFQPGRFFSRAQFRPVQHWWHISHPPSRYHTGSYPHSLNRWDKLPRRTPTSASHSPKLSARRKLCIRSFRLGQPSQIFVHGFYAAFIFGFCCRQHPALTVKIELGSRSDQVGVFQTIEIESD